MDSSLDTNIIMRYFWNDIPKQRKKVIKLLRDRSQIFHISDLVIAEVVFNLQGTDMSRQEIVAVLSSFFSIKNISVNPLITDQVLPYFVEHPALSFVDCYAAFEADAHHAEPLWTFDRKLANQHPSAKLL